MISDSAARCVVQVREHPRAAWRSLGAPCRVAEALRRVLDVRDEYPAVRIVQDGTVIYCSDPAPR